MDITKIIAVGIIGTVLAVTVRSHRPEIAIGIAAATGLVIISQLIEPLKNAIQQMREICADSGISIEYFELVLKIIGIAYLTQFAAETAKDAGEAAIAKKIEFSGKAAVMVIMMPVVKNLLEMIANALSSF